MPKYRVETNSGTYEIEADREPTANDVESYLRQSQASASAAESVATETAPTPPVEAATTPTAVLTMKRPAWADDAQTTPSTEVTASVDQLNKLETPAEPKKPETATEAIGNDLKANGWGALNRTERWNLFVRNLPKYMGSELLGIGKGAEGMAERTIPTVIGQKIGSATRIPGAERVGGAAGAMIGETIAQTREGGTKYRPGAILGAGISGAVTGKPLTGATQSEVMKEGAKFAGANLAGTVAETAIDDRDLTISQAGSAVVSGLLGAQVSKVLARPKFRGLRDPIDSLEIQTLKDLQKEGVLVPPHKVDSGLVVPTALVGAEAMDAAVAKKNRFVWQRLAREDVGLSKEALPITVADLEKRRLVLAKPYEEITAFQTKAAQELKDRMTDAKRNFQDPHEFAAELNSPQTKPILDRLKILAAADVEELKKVRDIAQSARKAFKDGKPEAYDIWQKYQAKADAIENAIDRAGQEIGDPTLLERLRASRKQIAQTYTVENALVPGNGMVDPLVLARQILDGDKLTGNLEKIAKFQTAFRKEAVELSRLSNAEIVALNRGDMSIGNLVRRGVQKVSRGPAKALLLSDAVQEGLTNPQEIQNFSSALARYVSEEALTKRSSGTKEQEELRRYIEEKQ